MRLYYVRDRNIIILQLKRKNLGKNFYVLVFKYDDRVLATEVQRSTGF